MPKDTALTNSAPVTLPHGGQHQPARSWHLFQPAASAAQPAKTSDSRLAPSTTSASAPRIGGATRRSEPGHSITAMHRVVRDRREAARNADPTAPFLRTGIAWRLYRTRRRLYWDPLAMHTLRLHAPPAPRPIATILRYHASSPSIIPPPSQFSNALGRPRCSNETGYASGTGCACTGWLNVPQRTPMQ